MKVAVVGSRSLTNIEISKYIPEGTSLIITGGAKGIDTLAEKYADEHRISKIIIRPDYENYERCAPLKRNETIVKISDIIIVLWDEKSRGTKFTIDYAKQSMKNVTVYILK